METVVDAKEGKDVTFENRALSDSISQTSALKEIADPIVYKLVRVEHDGTLVPASDDEVMEVEVLLEDDRSEDITASGHTASISSHELSDDKTSIIFPEGLPKFEEHKVNGKKSTAMHVAAVEMEKLGTQVQDDNISMESCLDDSQILFGVGSAERLDAPSGLFDNGVLTSTHCTSLKPDFSKLKGEICLDNLSVKELQETFRATFGRDTSVKDKQWLKRRIAMGLSNSCDVSTATFVIEDSRVVKKGKEDDHASMDATPATTPAMDSVVAGKNDCCGIASVSTFNQLEHPLDVGNEGWRNPKRDNFIVEDIRTEQRAVKRIRKPTRRYIEEVSEVDSRDCSEKFISSFRTSGHIHSSAQIHVSPFRNLQSVGKPLDTRQDSFGGSGVQVPFVSRIRRGKPRENFMTLMKLEHCGMGVAARLINQTLGGCGPQSDDGTGNKAFKASRPVQEPSVEKPEKDGEHLEEKVCNLEENMNLGHGDLSKEDADDIAVAVPTTKGGMRRKHHRLWTLSEVIKLVEGVARFGAGRWSEIKRVAFASYSYRTSVDLKDKWRNLLRASLAQLPADKGVQNSRKQASIPIPAAILVRVRELAEMQSQMAPDLGSIMMGGQSGISVKETGSGYL